MLEVGSDVADNYPSKRDVVSGDSSLSQTHDSINGSLHAILFSRDNQNLLGDFDVFNHVQHSHCGQDSLQTKRHANSRLRLVAELTNEVVITTATQHCSNRNRSDDTFEDKPRIVVSTPRQRQVDRRLLPRIESGTISRIVRSSSTAARPVSEKLRACSTADNFSKASIPSRRIISMMVSMTLSGAP